MKATKQVVVDQFGGPEVLTVIDTVVGQPTAGQCLVRVEAAGVL